MGDNFIDISLTQDNLDRYYHRTSILKAINSNLNRFQGSLLDTGCGKMPYKNYLLEKSNIKEYIGLDIENAKIYDEQVQPDYKWDGKRMPFEDESFESAFATEVLEHVSEVDIFLGEVFRVLKQGGVFFFTTPFLWPLHEPPYDEFRYTPFSMERILIKNGFTNISIEALGGWNASLGQMIGLWIRRAPLTGRKKRILKALSLPIVKYLFKHDDPKPNFFKGPMITGISGVAYKQ
ncbi:methyltransferase domain-containing protein [Catalinimonas niigatensis]|uniref:methyltransferase domain-containing protein n=1 Tax=Catalinimonas niigatensis TaxID=1397264 RepID=UPI002665B41A|nr:class I SAM-dependent methyltransferase [Catalinimonas niigatensis]WPP53316.1 class I SAM-dependent methyltransferase [Catalinimonas niigatensis]